MWYNKLIVGAALAFSTTAIHSCKDGAGKKDGSDNTKVDTASLANKPGGHIKLDPNKKYVFITWDDGPQPPGSVNCRQVFKAQGVKASFFTVGMNAFSDFRKRIIDTLRDSYPQFLLCNHSWTHANNKYKLFYSQPDSAIADFIKMQDTYKVPVKIIRLPGMNSWVLNHQISGQKEPAEVCKRLSSLGYSVIGWDVEWQQGKHSSLIQGAEQMANMVKEKLASGYTKAQNSIVILSHDRLFGKPQDVDSLTKFITLLKQDPSIVFETIDHYPLVQGQ